MTPQCLVGSIIADVLWVVLFLRPELVGDGGDHPAVRVDGLLADVEQDAAAGAVGHLRLACVTRRTAGNHLEMDRKSSSSSNSSKQQQ